MKRTKKDIFYCAVAAAGIVFAVSLLVGCKHVSTPANTRPPQDSGAPVCLAEDPMPIPGSCYDLVTSENFSCVVCAHDRGCIDARVFSYCVSADYGCDDPRCRKIRGKK